MPALLLLIVTLGHTQGEHTSTHKVLSEAEQKAFLASRNTEPRLLGAMDGSFDRFANIYFTLRSVALHTDSKEVNAAKVANVFPDFYKPTYAELFAAVARQTRSKVRYDTKQGHWVFEADKTLPFTLKLAPGWTAEDRGLYVKYTPPTSPVGMDIYSLGTYSSDTPDPGFEKKVREALALRLTAPFKDVKLEDMKLVKLAGIDALHLETTKLPRPGLTWRQWVFLKDGHAFAIVSALDKEVEGQLLPDVQAMVASFKLAAK